MCRRRSSSAVFCCMYCREVSCAFAASVFSRTRTVRLCCLGVVKCSPPLRQPRAWSQCMIGRRGRAPPARAPCPLSRYCRRKDSAADRSIRPRAGYSPSRRRARVRPCGRVSTALHVSWNQTPQRALQSRTDALASLALSSHLTRSPTSHHGCVPKSALKPRAAGFLQVPLSKVPQPRLVPALRPFPRLGTSDQR
jgi:hypothetical protein